MLRIWYASKDLRQLLFLVLAILPALARAQAPAPRMTAAQMLDQAIARFHAFDDQGARQLLRAALDNYPPPAIATRAYLYLGIIAVNALDEDLAREEFRRALRLQTTAELPADASPKADILFKMAFTDVQREARREAQGAQLTPAPNPAAPLAEPLPSTVTAGSQPITPAPPPNSHWLSYVLGGAAVAAAVVAVYGGVQVVSYQNLAGQPPQTVSAVSYRSAQSSAQAWQYGWVTAAALGVALGGTAVFVW